MIEFIKNIFRPKEIKFSENFKMSGDFDSIIKNNRNVLNKIKEWISPEVYSNSIYKYGIPEEIKHLIDLPINDEPIYSDYIVSYAKNLKKSISYIELGVSVGKNFHQILNAFRNSNFTGFDIEEINPVLKENLVFNSSIEFDTPNSSLKKNKSSLSNFTDDSNSITYISADIWDENAWKKLEGKKFNIIFSDALHDPKALIFEFEMLTKYNLLDDEFLFFWDDLVEGEMREAFKKIAIEIKKKYQLKDDNFHLVKVNGWLGQNYPIKHDVGLITKFN